MAKDTKSNRNLYQDVIREETSEDQIRAAVRDLQESMLGAQKVIWPKCSKCKSSVMVETVDAMTRIKAIQALQEGGWGKPKPDEDERKQGFVLNRVVVEPMMEVL